MHLCCMRCVQFGIDQRSIYTLPQYLSVMGGTNVSRSAASRGIDSDNHFTYIATELTYY